MESEARFTKTTYSSWTTALSKASQRFKSIKCLYKGQTIHPSLYKNIWRQMRCDLHNVSLICVTQSEYWRSRSTVPSVTTNLTLLGLVEPMEWEVAAGP